MPDEPRYEVRVTLTGDDWKSIVRRLRRLGDITPARVWHLNGCADGVTYAVDVSEVEVVSEPPTKVRA